MKNNSAPFFSIIIPCYNVVSFVAITLHSLKSQTFSDFEIILVDDCSTDNTYEYCRRWAENSTLLVTLLRNKENSGPGASRSWGVQHAKGRFVGFCDSDDWYEPDLLELAYSKIQSEKAELVFFDYYRNYGNGKRKHIGCTRSLSNATSMNEYVAMAFDALWGLVVKSEIIKKISMPALYNSEDAAVVPVLSSLAGKATFIPMPLYNYLHRKQSLSTSRNKRIYQGFIDAFQFVCENVPAEFAEAKEYRGIHLVLYGAVFKAIDAGVSGKEIRNIVCDFENKYPQWWANKYVKSLPLRKRFFLYLVRKRFFAALHIYVTVQRLILYFL